MHPDTAATATAGRSARPCWTLSGKRLRVWAHGGHPAARHLATRLGLTLFRELRQMRRPLPGPGPARAGLPPEGVTVRTFRPGEDDAAWLALNAAAFAHHPEQGCLTQRDLDDRKAEPWFDPAGFFLAERGGGLVGFHWTKAHAEERLGEVYVVGVSPGEQGGGLGRALTAIGLRHLAVDRGLPTAMLYVDADNAAAVAVYERPRLHHPRGGPDVPHGGLSGRLSPCTRPAVRALCLLPSAGCVVVARAVPRAPAGCPG